MSSTLVDSNVLLDVLTEDPAWVDWSSAALESQAERSVLVIDPLIYAEVSIRFERLEELEEALPPAMFRSDPLPCEAAFLPRPCFVHSLRPGWAAPCCHSSVRR